MVLILARNIRRGFHVRPRKSQLRRQAVHFLAIRLSPIVFMSQQGRKVCPQSPTHWLIVKEEIDLFGNVHRMAERDIASLYDVLEISQVKWLIEALSEWDIQ